MNSETNKTDVLDMGKIVKLLLSKKKVFVKVWIVTLIVSCLYIFPQPRYYTCTVKLAPEIMGENVGGLSSIASSFGFNIGGAAGSDAIYPTLYPTLFESPEFLTGLFNVEVKSVNGEINTTYFDYLNKHKKKNPITYPFNKVKSWILNLFKEKKYTDSSAGFDPFRMSEEEYKIMMSIQSNIACSVDKKTDVISISVSEQDPLISATLAEKVKEHLQDFIIEYRTKKSKLDHDYYHNLLEEAKLDYEKALKDYSSYADSHKNAGLQSAISMRNKLENEVSIKQSTYQALTQQLEATKARIQERTPAFTTLQSATVPIKPTGPKRMFFVFGMIVLSTCFTSVYLYRKYIADFGF